MSRFFGLIIGSSFLILSSSMANSMDHHQEPLKLKQSARTWEERKKELNLCPILTVELMRKHPDIFRYGENLGTITLDGNTWTVDHISWEEENSGRPQPDLFTYISQPGMALRKGTEDVHPMNWESTKSLKRRQVRISCGYSTPLPATTSEHIEIHLHRDYFYVPPLTEHAIGKVPEDQKHMIPEDAQSSMMDSILKSLGEKKN